MLQNSDMFKKIKSIFVVEEPVNATGANEKDESIDSKGSTSAPISSPAAIDSTIEYTPASGSSEMKPDVKFTDLLLKAIESNNLQGFDYLEFKNSLKSLESVIPDENMRYKSAYEMAKTMGLNKEKLVQSANHYLGILTAEDKKFKDALSNQRAKQIQGRADQLAAVEKSILDKENMIKSLTKEIETAKSQLQAVRNEINDSVVKIDSTNQQFVASYNLVYSQIDGDIKKINQNL